MQWFGYRSASPSTRFGTFGKRRRKQPRKTKSLRALRHLTAEPLEERCLLSLVSFTKFEEPQGAAFAADSAGPWQGTIVGNPSVVPGHSGTALSFDGIDDQVALLANDRFRFGTGSFSVEMWVHASTFAGKDGPGVRIIEKDAYPYSWWVVDVLPDGRLAMGMCASNGVVVGRDVNQPGEGVSTIPITVGEWQHVAVVVDRENFRTRYYVNGQPAGEQVLPSDLGDLNVDDRLEPVRIGSGWNPFKGLIDEVAIFSEALTDAQVSDHFADGFNAPPKADAGGPYVGQAGVAVTLDASRSSDGDLDALLYRWDFDNNGTWDTAYSPNATVVHAWTANYSGKVAVEVSDGKEARTDTASVGTGGGTLGSYWAFDEGTGTLAADSVGHNDAFIERQGATWAESGHAGAALSFDGNVDYSSNDCVLVQDDPSLRPGTGSFSVAMWINPATFQGRQYDLWGRAIRVLEKVNWPYSWWALDVLADGRIGMDLRDSKPNDSRLNVNTGWTNSEGPSTGAIALNQWSHVAVVVDRLHGETQYYINGAPAGTQTHPADFVGNLDVAGSPLEIGSRWNPFSGLLDEVALFSGALTPQQVAQVMNSGLNRPPVAVDDAVAMWGQNVTIAASDLLANDSDPEGHAIAFVLEDLPSEGTLTDNGDGTYTYTPGPAFDGLDTFTYRATDGTNLSNLAAVTITHMLYVRNTADGGDGSLRWTMDNANSHPGLDTIRFAIPGAGVQTIQPLSALPAITDPVVIDGYSQPGASPNALPIGNNAVLTIELSGEMAGDYADGLTITAGNSTVRGLVINRFHGHFGVFLHGNGGNIVQGNFIGTDPNGTAAVPNLFGIYVSNAPDNTIGGTDAGARNVISGNPAGGLVLLGSGATGNMIAGNYIGTDASGTAEVHNDAGGIYLGNAPNNTIGGTDPGARNVISGSWSSGVTLVGSGATGNVIAGNFIGTDASGTAAVPNGKGIELQNAPNNTIGGTDPGARNVISGNSGPGVMLEGSGATGNMIAGNYVGTDLTGTVRLSDLFGIYVRNAPNNAIGGTDPGARNVISGNSGGVLLHGPGASGNVIAGNFIGTDASGTAAIYNGYGFWIEGPNNIIGGTDPGARNVISGNFYFGVWLNESGATGNVIAGNYIGTDASGTAAVPNNVGIYLYNAPDNTIGGTLPGQANTIAWNVGPGVLVSASAAIGNAVRRNSIFNNGGLGIDLGGDGVTANDPGDADAGPNDFQNFPVLMAAEAGIETRVQGTLNSAADTTFTLDFYANATADPSGYGEGQRWLGSTTVTTDPLGDATFDVLLTGATTAGQWVTATATAPDGSTSEFSAGVLIVNAAPVAADDAVPMYGQSVTIAASDLLANDSDPEGDPIAFVLVDAPGEGTLTDNGDGTYTYAMGPGFDGLDTFTYRASDGTNLSNLATVTITHMLYVRNTNDSGDGSLRWTIDNANVHPGLDTIKFAIPPTDPNHYYYQDDSVSGSLTRVAATTLEDASITDFDPDFPGAAHSWYTIRPTSAALPLIWDPVTIDGTTQPGFGGTPVIELDGSQTPYWYGLYIQTVNTTVRGLVINGFDGGGVDSYGIGIQIYTAGGHVIEGNYIGTDVSGTMAAGNAMVGINMHNSDGNRIGSNGDGLDDAAERNVISGNQNFGVRIVGSFNIVAGNYIGTDATGTRVLGNGTGIQISAPWSAHNLIGTNGDGLADDAERNIISANADIGVYISTGGDADLGNVVAGNYIGTDVYGTTALGNGGAAGVAVSYSPGTRIGTDGNGTGDAAEGNVISGNLRAGVALWWADDCVVAGNFIGTDYVATSALPNQFVGVEIWGARQSQIGSDGDGVADSAERNVISGNADDGVLLWDPSEGNLLAGNYIGTDGDGAGALPNGHQGIDVRGAQATRILRNVISGNAWNGVALTSGAASNVVAGNMIGTDATGTKGVGNLSHGVAIVDAQQNLIGTDGDGISDGDERNVISANAGAGVAIVGQGAQNNVVAGNYIGTDVWGTSPLGNEGDGVVSTAGALGNRIGDPGAGNTIAFNGLAGVAVPWYYYASLGAHSSIRANAIFSNGGLGIDLGSDNDPGYVGPTPNDPLDADLGPNDLQNFPVLTSAQGGATTRVAGTINSTPNTTLVLDFYANQEVDPSGYGEGQRWLGSATVTTNASGDATFDVLLTGATSTSEVVTATATDADGNTSEFSAVVQVEAPLPASLQGLVWEDFNDNGLVDLGETAVEGVVITITGTDDRGNAVLLTQTTDAQGIYEFTDLRPGTYAIKETQPSGFVDGREVLGEVLPTGTNGVIDSEGDKFSGIVLVAGSAGVNYNFGERVDGGQVAAGQTANVGFWQNKHGQALIRALNGGETSTVLGHWLADTFPNMYGGLEGTTNAGIAATYQVLFKRTAKTSPGGPPKLDAQVMAVALATFVTKESLVSLRYVSPGEDPITDPALVALVESYGFVVTAGGVGSASFNVGDSGAAFNLADHTSAQIIDLLLATDGLSRDGLLYDDDAHGQAGHGEIDAFEALLRRLANDVYAAISRQGSI